MTGSAKDRRKKQRTKNPPGQTPTLDQDRMIDLTGSTDRRRRIRTVLEYVGIPVSVVVAMWLVLVLVRSCG